MRPIKFRAWDKENKVLVPVWELDVADNNDKEHSRYATLYNENSESLDYVVNQEKIELMQFTGLLDKNGKEIYEADILNCISSSDFLEETGKKVVFLSSDLQFCVDKENSNIGLPLTWGGHKSLEVIGNIYENPELLASN